MDQVFLLPQAVEGTQMTFAKSLNLPHGQIQCGSIPPKYKQCEVTRINMDRSSFPQDIESCRDLESIVLRSNDAFPWTSIKTYLDNNSKESSNEKDSPIT